MKYLFLTVLACASIQGALGETTATIFPGDGGEGGGVTSLHGQIVGTGAQGTTYVISGQVSGVQATATLVEDSTHLSEDVVLSTSGAFAELVQVCNYDSNHIATCTQVAIASVNGIQTATTSAASGSLSLAPVALSQSSATGYIFPTVVSSSAALISFVIGMALVL